MIKLVAQNRFDVHVASFTNSKFLLHDQFESGVVKQATSSVQFCCSFITAPLLVVGLADHLHHTYLFGLEPLVVEDFFLDILSIIS